MDYEAILVDKDNKEDEVDNENNHVEDLSEKIIAPANSIVLTQLQDYFFVLVDRLLSQLCI